MSKLIEALKRAEELRRQRRLQTDAAKLNASEKSAPVNEIEAALIAEEARMAAKRVLKIYEEEKLKAATSLVVATNVPGTIAAAIPTIVPTPSSAPSPTYATPVTIAEPVKVTNVNVDVVVALARSDEVVRLAAEDRIAVEETKLAAAAAVANDVAQANEAAAIASAALATSEVRLAALVKQREAAEEKLRLIAEKRAKAEENASQLASDIAQREQETSTLFAALEERIEQDASELAEMELRLTTLEGERDVAVKTLRDAEIQHAEKEKIAAEKSTDLERKVRLALEVKNATAASMAMLAAADERAQADRTAQQHLRLAALDDVNLQRNLLDNQLLSAQAKRAAAEAKVATDIDARIKAETLAVEATKARIDAEAELDRSVNARHEAEAAALAIAEANVQREAQLAKVALENSIVHTKATEIAAANREELDAAAKTLDHDTAQEIKKRSQLLTQQAAEEKHRLTQLEQLTMKRMEAEKLAKNARAARQAVQTKLEEETRLRIAAEEVAISTTQAEKHAEDELAQAANEKREAEGGAAATATKSDALMRESIERLLSEAKSIAAETAEIIARVEFDASQLSTKQAEALIEAEAAVQREQAQRDNVLAQEESLQAAIALATQQSEISVANANAAMRIFQENAAQQLSLLETVRIDIEAKLASEMQSRQKAEDAVQHASNARIVAEQQLADEAAARLADEAVLTNRQSAIAESEARALEAVERLLSDAQSMAAETAETHARIEMEAAKLAAKNADALALANAALEQERAQRDALIAEEKLLQETTLQFEADSANANGVMRDADEKAASEFAKLEALRLEIDVRWKSAVESRERAEAAQREAAQARLAAERELADATSTRLKQEQTLTMQQNKLAASERDITIAAEEKMRAEMALSETLAAKILALDEAAEARAGEAKLLQAMREQLIQGAKAEALAMAEAKAETERIRDAETNPLLRMQLPEADASNALNDSAEAKPRKLFWLSAASIVFTALGFFAATVWQGRELPSDKTEFAAREAVLARGAHDVAKRYLANAIDKAVVLDVPLRLKMESSLRATPAPGLQTPKK